ncbi:MAG: DUF2085 domain-containing protein, partial [Anaerolineae bacterium]|nr:DUF2085 domain-containing protein [Anaerolineae bacterium]
PTHRPDRHDGLLALLALIAIVVVLLAPPHDLLAKADRAGFAVCHQLPERTFVIAGRPLPLCARCSGTFLAALAGMIMLTLRGRGRAGRLPERRYLAVLGLFLLAWAVDGTNSFLTFFPGAPRLYEPNNLLRLITGTLQGLAIAAFMIPLLNLGLWAAPGRERVIGSWADLAWMLVSGAVVIGLVTSGWPPLLYPLALLSGAAIACLLGLLNALGLLILLRRDGRAQRWREVLAPLLAGLALALLEIVVIGLARTMLTERLGLPI